MGRTVVVGVKVETESRELLTWTLINIAKPGDRIIALHVLNKNGQLGDVMKESAKIAHIVARAIILEKDADNKFFANAKLHLHVPEGATPKDGSSAGCTMITSSLSLAMKKPVIKDLVMTGEVTLLGKSFRLVGLRKR